MKKREESSATERAFLLIVQGAGALSLGLMAGFLFSVKEVNPAIRYEFSWQSWLSFLIVTTLSWILTGMLLRNQRATAGGRRVLSLIGFCGLALGGLAVVVARSLKNLSHEKLVEVAQGAGLALFFLVIVGFLFWRTVRFLNQDAQRVAPNPRQRGQ